MFTIAGVTDLSGAAPAGTGLWRLRQAPPTAILTARALAAGWDVARVDGRRVRDRDSAFDAIADGAGFPDWFGRNLDALADCLGDLSWRTGDRHLLVWTHADRLGLLPEGDRTALVSVLSDVADGERLGVILLDG